jgi:2-keto-4-pentenoate hydratase/2-oxohepta-3-ene-1,7-dioic acid hydratase in catechol pathway
MRVGNLSDRLTLFTERGAVDVEQASDGLFGPDPQAVYARWDEFRCWGAQHRDASGAEFSPADLGAPSPRPPQIFGIGANYRDHIAEGEHLNMNIKLPEYPPVFTKFLSSFTGPHGQIPLPSATVDWEAELVVVIGKEAHDLDSTENGWDYVAGLTVGQDLSDRVVQLRDQIPQLSLGKSFPGFSPTGPWLVTPDEFANPDDVELGCAVNGDTKQKGRTSDLHFSVPALIAELSTVVVLYPGDVIFTGTPSGVGFTRTPPVYLAAGDELVTTIEGIGEMRHTFVTA